MPRWRAVDIDDAAMHFAMQSGFLSLEVETLEGEAVEAKSETVDTTLHQGKVQESKERAKRKKRMVESNDKCLSNSSDSISTADAPAKKRREVASSAAAPSPEHSKGSHNHSKSSGNDLFAQLAEELSTTGVARKAAKCDARQNSTNSALPSLCANDPTQAPQTKMQSKPKGKHQPTTMASDAQHKNSKHAGSGDIDVAPAADAGYSATHASSDMVAPLPATELTPVGWSAFGLQDELIVRLNAIGFTVPTPIQRECLPAAVLGQRDVVGAAETGSGKTLAFGLPILQRLLQERGELLAPPGKGDSQLRGPLFALIIAPTRELAAQVAAHLQAVAPKAVQIVSLVGGMSIEKQRRQLSRAPEVVVGTPGRIWELISDATCAHLIHLQSLRFFVLDEVDRMVEQGHYKELQLILRHLDGIESDANDNGSPDGKSDKDTSLSGSSHLPVAASSASRRQTFLFSATLMLPPKAREANAKRLMKFKPAKTDSTMDKLLRMIVFRNSMKVVDLSRQELVATGLEQVHLSCTRDEKEAFLLLLFRTRLCSGRTIVFTNAITALQRLRSLLALLEVPTLALQGGMQQRARLKSLDRFKATPGCVLLATDVAARGLDIEGINYVVHYQLPRSAEVYVHRSGRTARKGTAGLSIALVEPADMKAYRLLCSELGMGESLLPELPIRSELLPRAREMVSIAKQLDQAAHMEHRKTSNTQWQKQLAQEMDLPSASDEEEDEDEVARRLRLKRKQETQRLGDKLKRLIQRWGRPAQGAPLHLAVQSQC